VVAAVEALYPRNLSDGFPDMGSEASDNFKGKSCFFSPLAKVRTKPSPKGRIDPMMFC
jgi:hypothetical protein